MTPFPTHISTATAPRARGAEFGARWSAETRAAVTAYTDLFAALGATGAQVRGWAGQALDRTAAWAPDLAVEMAGLAAGAGLEPWQVAALNARTEILAALRDGGEGECSTSVALPGGGRPPRTLQTWDWLDGMRDVGVLWEYEPRPGRRVRTFTEFGVLAKIGVTGGGLGAHFNILKHTSDGGDIGVPVHLLVRRILDEADDLDAAVAILRGARTSASSVITVVTWDGERADARALEVSPAGLGVVAPDADGLLLHTNHFLDPALAPGERLGTDRPGTYARYTHLSGRARELWDTDPTGRAKAMVAHLPDGAPVCAHSDPADPPDQRWDTLATIGLDLPAGRLEVHRGGPCGVTPTTWQTF
ncbi:C45 family peptidase [Actinomadura sp. WMMB 499]|uniref:C45 family autoproteolytic acyltransferase/hydolase n=1 Tax=Actinomadura sp. WMMB 499 TaxID=1219491 RepID=UPI0012462551|nr:C45 family peptidase [Actinomadura sp. WMMB 499]QFG25676.1 peptidase C45 [Actinomadura sp. WMMB 499]